MLPVSSTAGIFHSFEYFVEVIKGLQIKGLQSYRMLNFETQTQATSFYTQIGCNGQSGRLFFETSKSDK